MKIPNSVKQIHLAKPAPLGPYPPLGFFPFIEGALGNGDYFGLYYPLGHETSEPIVCEMAHDSGLLILRFRNLEKFLEWADGKEEGGDFENIPEDDSFASNLYEKAKKFIQEKDLEKGIDLLKQAILSVPEVSEFWIALAGQLRRTNQKELADLAALESIRSAWHFGIPSQSAISQFARIDQNGPLSNDPLVRRNKELNLKFGGTKENAQYDILKEAIFEYHNQAKHIEGLKMSQNRAFMLESETHAFQERYQYDREAWQSEFKAECHKYIGSERQI